MAIFELLSSKEDIRKGGTDCEFNGYLEDFVGMTEDEKIRDIFSALLENDNDLKVIKGLNAGISKESISNAVIRYKDITKLDSKAVKVPYIIYGKKDDKEKAVIITDGPYIYAKGMYYALTEAGAALAEGKNDCIAADLESDLVSVLGRVFNDRAGMIQRELDRKHFANYDEILAEALRMSEGIRPGIDESVAAGADKETAINDAVSKWYLLKKLVYVQYMIDKNMLKERHEGNVKHQRNKAKENADSIRFVSISELWRGNNA